MVWPRLRTLALGTLAVLAPLVPGCDCDAPPPDDPPAPPLAISSLTPLQGSTSGGTAVTILGQQFAAAGGVDSVTVGGAAATALSIVSDGELTVLTPAGAAGPADVVVSSSGLAASVTETAGFTYLGGPAPAPSLTSCAPPGGPTGGGTPVTLLGSAFQAGATVAFAGTAATGVQVRSAGRITCTTPAGPVGPATVTVTNPDLQASNLTNGFTYSNTPVVAAITPAGGLTDGGTTVTITGSNFVAGATADLGGAPVAVTLVSPTQIVGTTGARGPGDVAVTVHNPGAVDGSGASYAYRYGPVSQTAAFVWDTAAGIDCRRRWYLDFRSLPLQTDLLVAGLQTPTGADPVNAFALDWFRGYVLQAVCQMYGRNADGTGVSGSSLNVTFVGLAPGGGAPGCATPATDYSRLCIGGCAPTTATGCPGNPAGCSGPVVGLSLYDNISGLQCGARAEDNCTAPAYGGAGCTGVFVRDITNLWGGALAPSLMAADLGYLDGSVSAGVRYNAIHGMLQQLAWRVAVVVAHECAHSMGLVAGLSVNPCQQSSGVCGATGTHNDCCAQNLMRSSTSFAGTFSAAGRPFSGRPGSAVQSTTCYAGGASSWAQLVNFVGLTP